MHAVGPRALRTPGARSPRRDRSEMSTTTITSAASISLAARSERSEPGGMRKSKRDGMGVGFAIATWTRRAVRRCHNATSLPTPSPSAFTWVVRATRRPGPSTAATSCDARTRSGGIGTVTDAKYVEKGCRGKTSRNGVEQRLFLKLLFTRSFPPGHPLPVPIMRPAEKSPRKTRKRAPPTPRAAGAPRRGQARVLIADDHPAVLTGVRALLESRGWDVVAEARDGQEAVRLARRLRPDVAVLDVVMPLLDGVSAAREMARSMPGIGLIVLTGMPGEPTVPE